MTRLVRSRLTPRVDRVEQQFLLLHHAVPGNLTGQLC